MFLIQKIIHIKKQIKSLVLEELILNKALKLLSEVIKQ